MNFYSNPARAAKIAALGSALAARYVPLPNIDAEAQRYVGASIFDIIRELIPEAAKPRMQPHEIIAAALHSTSDFPHLLADAAGKVLLPAYQAAKPSYKTFSAQRNFNDFKPHKFLRVGDFPDLLEVGEGGEIKRGTIGENRELVTMATYGRIFPITRKALINDDLGTFLQVMAGIGARVANFENSLVMALINENNGAGPAMSDGHNLFDETNHLNSASAAALSLTSLSAGRATIRKQTGLDGQKIDLSPSVLLVGPDNETLAEQMLTQTTPASASDVNPMPNKLRTLAVDAHIPNYRWYLFGDPNAAPAFIHGSLPGQEGPIVTERPGWDQDGLEIKVIRDFGAGPVDYRPAYFNPGAAPT